MHGAAHVSHGRLRRAPSVALASAACLVYAVVAGSEVSKTAPGSTAGKTYVVKIEGLRFDPPALTVRRGDRVVWVNNDLFPHTVTADAKRFDSRDIQPGASWTYVARAPGDYPYACTYHPSMTGNITVLSRRTVPAGA